MTIKITGIREYNFKDDNNRQVEGMSVYYQNVLAPKDGQHAAGYCTEKFSIKRDTVLYAKMLGIDYSEPFEAKPVYEFVPGSKRPVLTDIEI